MLFLLNMYILVSGRAQHLGIAPSLLKDLHTSRLRHTLSKLIQIVSFLLL